MDFLGICTTASYFGDKLLPSRHIYKVVDSIFETMTLISQDADDMTHAKFVTLLAEQKLVKNVFLVRNEKPKLTNHPSVLRATKKNLHTRPEIDDNSLGKNSLKATSDEDEVKSTQISNDYTDLDSHMSSLMLTPLAKIPISSYLSRERVRKSPTDSSSIMSSIRLTRLTEIPISSHSPVETVKKSQTDSSSIVSSIKLTPLAIIPISSNFTAEPLLRKLSSSQMSSTGLIPFN